MHIIVYIKHYFPVQSLSIDFGAKVIPSHVDFRCKPIFTSTIYVGRWLRYTVSNYYYFRAIPTTYTIILYYIYIYTQKVIFSYKKNTHDRKPRLRQKAVVDEINPLPIHHRLPHSWGPFLWHLPSLEFPFETYYTRIVLFR